MLRDTGFDYAILHPMTVGVLPDWHLESAILEATNRMLAERWLHSGTYQDQFLGTIRVNPNDLDAAVREIHRWKEDAKFVQIGIPMQSQARTGVRTTSPSGAPPVRPACRWRSTGRWGKASPTRRLRPEWPGPTSRCSVSSP